MKSPNLYVLNYVVVAHNRLNKYVNAQEIDTFIFRCLGYHDQETHTKWSQWHNCLTEKHQLC